MINIYDEKRRNIAERVINADREMLVMKFRYMVRALYALKPREIEKNIGINYGTDGEYYYYDLDRLLTDYLDDAVDSEMVYLHSVIHCLYMHPFFADRYEYREIWNLSCDIYACYIMSALQKESISPDQENGIDELKNKVKVITAQSLYRYLSTRLEEGMITEGYLEGMEQIFHVDDHKPWYLDENDTEANKLGESKSTSGSVKKKEKGQCRKASEHGSSVCEQWREIADRTEVEYRAQQVSAGLDHGTEKGDILESLMGIKRSYMDYTDFLRKFAVIEERMLIDMDSFDYTFYTFGLELYKDMPLIEPLEYKEDYTIREFVIAIDTSGSCDLELIRKFLTATYDILFESIIDDKLMEIHLLQCDAALQEDYIVREKEEMDKYIRSLTIRGRGGTDFRPVFEYVKRIRENGGLRGIRGLIYFTDGYGIFPTAPTDYKTAFVFAEMDTNVVVPPWIMKTYIEKELL